MSMELYPRSHSDCRDIQSLDDAQLQKFKYNLIRSMASGSYEQFTDLRYSTYAEGRTKVKLNFAHPHSIIGIIDPQLQAVADDRPYQQGVGLVTHLEDVFLVDQTKPTKCRLQQSELLLYGQAPKCLLY